MSLPILLRTCVTSNPRRCCSNSPSPAAAAATLPACDVPAPPATELLPAGALGRAAAAAAGGGRAGRGAALHEPVDAEHVGRYALLSARQLHDEVQPQAERADGGAAGHRRPASARSRKRRSRACLQLLFELQQMLAEISGLPAVSLQPAAGAQGELTALLVAAAYFRASASSRARRCSPPTAPTAPTRPAPRWPASTPSRSRATRDGFVDLDDLAAKLDDQIAVFMITNPSTLGLFDRQMPQIAELVHERGGLIYLDGANMNAILGITRPGDFGADMMHYNPHKTFSGPHGGGGPGAGPICVAEKLGAVPAGAGRRAATATAIAWPTIGRMSIGRVRSFFGNVGVLVRAYCYIRTHGPDGLEGASPRTRCSTPTTC